MSAVQPESLLPWRVVTELEGEPEGPRARRLLGAVLVADITGYTRITQRLCDQGDEGLGQLSDLLDREFSRYLDVVAAHGGEVLYFAGDALIACFLASATDVEPSLARARACAAALAALSGTAPSAAPGEQVTLHLGVGSGPMWVARLGGWYGRWELLVGGAAVRAAFAAASSSPSPSPSPPPAPEPEPPAVEAPRAFDDSWWWGLVPPRLLEDARGERRVHSELRQVNALFVRVTGLDEDGPDALARHQELVFAVHETLRTISTASGRFLIDDKGLVFVLVMGDPGNTHADDVERAVSFAKELEVRARAQGLKLKMGFAAGRTFCGVIGNQVRRQYVAIGPAMNLAARLMDAAGEGLIAAVPLPAHGLSLFRLIPEGTLRLKGIDDPVQVARVETDDATDAGGALYGRAGEQQRLDGVIAAAMDGKGGLAFVVGEAGIGKSTLLGWFRRRARERGLRCVLGEGDLTEAASTYFAFRPIVRALLSAAPHDGVEVLRARLLAWLTAAGQSEAFAPLFNSLLPLQLPETPTTLQLRGQTRADVLVDLLVELVRGSSAEPIAILIEDAHWIDSASALLVEQITVRLERPLVLLTARPEAEEGGLALLRSAASVRLDLAPLDVEAIAQLAASTCGGPVEASVVAVLREQTAGNPLFAQEYVRELRDSGRLAFEETAWRLSHRDGNLAKAPTTLQALIASRIDGLSPEAQAALRVAAVIGQQVDRALLEEVMTRTEGSNLASALASLARRQLVLADGGGDRVRFAHALIQAVAYDSLLFETRIQLHRAVAEAIEGRVAPEPGRHVLLVHHWSRARNQVRAVAHAESAAEEAIQLGAYREARAFASLCVQAAAADVGLATPERRTRWELTLADAATGLGNLDRRRMHATNALALTGRRIPRTPAGALVGGAAVLAARGLHRLARLTPSPAAVSGSADLVTRGYRQMAVVSYFANEPFQILYYAARALVNAERAGPSPDLCGALAEIGAWFGFAGFEPLARPFFAQAFVLARKLDDRPAEAHVNMVYSLYSVGRGEWERVLGAVDRCQALCLEIGDRVQWANAQIIRFWRHHYRGELHEADVAAQALDETARESGNLQQRSWALHALGLCRIEDGAIPQALELLTRSVSLVEARRDRTATLSTLGGLALAHALSGDTARARDIARRTMEELSAIRRPMGHAMLEGLGAIAEIMVRSLAASPGVPSAAADARAAVALLRRQAIVFPIAAPRFRYWQSRLLEVEGRSPTRARRRGLEAANVLGMATEERRLTEPPALRQLEVPRA